MIIREDLGVYSGITHFSAQNSRYSLRPLDTVRRVRFAEEKKEPENSGDSFLNTQAQGLQKVPKAASISPQEFFKQIEIMKKLNPEQRQKIYNDLRLLYIGFWRDMLPSVAKGMASVADFGVSLPPYMLKGATSVMNSIIPPSKKLYSTEDADKLLQEILAHSDERKARIADPLIRISSPAALESALDQDPFIRNIQLALQIFGKNGEIGKKEFDVLFERVKAHKGEFDPDAPLDSPTFRSKAEFEAAKTLVGAFPLMAQLSEKEETLTPKALDKFRQTVKDSVPFLYDMYGQKASNYVTANLYYLGIASALPDVGFLKKQSIKLNENPTYRKVVQWSKDYQVSDTQFLPIYAFIDALYAQGTGYMTNLMKDLSLGGILLQMTTLDGAFNVLNFAISKAQVLLVGWEEEKPDRNRAQYEKQLKLLSREKDLLQQKLEEEKEKLAAEIAANPDKKEELEKKFQETVLTPITEKTEELMQQWEKFQNRLDKLLGVKPMPFLEKMWNKPPKILNDLKYMVPISVAVSLPYDLLYYNKFTDYPMSALSLKFITYFSYMTLLGAVGNVIAKQIIHGTQDKAKLYQLGKKDDLLAETTREFLANLKGTMETLSESENPKIQQLGKSLEAYYTKLSVPLIGEESEQSNTEKTLNREAKLLFSMEKSDAIQKVLLQIDLELDNPARQSERSELKKMRRFIKSLYKLHERAAYIPTAKSRFELQLLSDRYNRDFLKTGLESKIPPEFTRFFQNTLSQSTAFLSDLQQKYPRAEVPYEPLLLKANTDREKFEKFLNSALADCNFDLAPLKESFLKRFFMEGNRREKFECKQNRTLKDTLSAFSRSAETAEERAALDEALKSLKKVQKGLKRDLFLLLAKSRAEADKELADYRQLRKDYAAETSRMPLGIEKIDRLGNQMGMALNQGYKKAAYLDKYNNWLTGYPWIPVHSLLNLAGRLGLLSIVQGQLAPPGVMLCLWLFGQVPMRAWIMVNRKFMVMRDSYFRDRADLEQKIQNGMGPYIQNYILKEGQQPQKLKAVEKPNTPSSNPFAGPGGKPDPAPNGKDKLAS